MNVLVVIEFLCPNRGSIDESLHLVLNELAARGAGVGAVTSDKCRYEGVREESGEQAYRVWVSKSIRVHADVPVPYKPGVIGEAVAWADRVVVHEPYQLFSLHAMRAALRLHRRVYVWCDRYYPLGSAGRPLLWMARRLVRRLREEKLFGGLMYITSDAYEWCRSALGLPTDTPGYHAPLAYNPDFVAGAEEEWWRYSLQEISFRYDPLEEADLVAGYVGRINWWKGVDVLDKAIGLLRESGVNAHAVIFHTPWGGIPRGLIGSPGVTTITTSRRAKYSMLAMLKRHLPTVYVQPSRKEPFGLALVEAMALGLPAVASNVAGPAEILGAGQYGLLVPPGDPARLAEALLQASLGAERLGRLARRRAQRYTPARVAEDWLRGLGGE